MYVFQKKATLLITSKQKVQYDLHRCVTPQLRFVAAFRVGTFWDDMTTSLVIYCGVFFVEMF